MDLDLSQHPLNLQLIHATTAKEWFERFRKATTTEELNGLLEAGLLIEEEDPCSLLSFYFDVADGYSDERNFKGKDEEYAQARLRLRIARKAWKMLRRDYFSPRKSKDPDESDEYLFYSGRFSRWSPVLFTKDGYQLFNRLVSFFTERDMLPNMPSHGDDKVARTFAIRFATWIAEGVRPNAVAEPGPMVETWRTKIATCAKAAIPNAIYILDKLGALDSITKSDLEHPDEVLVALERRALNPWNGKRDEYESLDRALRAGNKAATAHLLVAARKRVYEQWPK